MGCGASSNRQPERERASPLQTRPTPTLMFDDADIKSFEAKHAEREKERSEQERAAAAADDAARRKKREEDAQKKIDQERDWQEFEEEQKIHDKKLVDDIREGRIQQDVLTLS